MLNNNVAVPFNVGSKGDRTRMKVFANSVNPNESESSLFAKVLFLESSSTRIFPRPDRPYRYQN